MFCIVLFLLVVALNDGMSMTQTQYYCSNAAAGAKQDFLTLFATIAHVPSCLASGRW